jgi:hypothetical protein
VGYAGSLSPIIVHSSMFKGNFIDMDDIVYVILMCLIETFLHRLLLL